MTPTDIDRILAQLDAVAAIGEAGKDIKNVHPFQNEWSESCPSVGTMDIDMPGEAAALIRQQREVIVIQPMETAKMDGTDILLHRDGCPPIVAGFFHGEWQVWDTGNEIIGEPIGWTAIPTEIKAAAPFRATTTHPTQDRSEDICFVRKSRRKAKA